MSRASGGTAGFTLIEVMVALAILAVLSVLTATAMKSAVDNRTALSADISRDQRLSDTLRVIRSDLSSAFHYRDTQIAMINEILAPTPTPGPGGDQTGQTQQPTPPPPPPPIVGQPGQPVNPLGTPRPTPVQVTNFVGDTASVYFTSTTNSRTIRDSQEGDLAKIGYFLKACKGEGGKGNSNCLYRSVSPYLDDDVTKDGVETMLVENVEEFKLRYLGPDHDDYVNQWKTDKNGDDSTKDIFPWAVEVNLTIHNKEDKRDKPVTGSVLVPISFPNNVKKKKGNETETDVTKKTGP